VAREEADEIARVRRAVLEKELSAARAEAAPCPPTKPLDVFKPYGQSVVRETAVTLPLFQKIFLSRRVTTITRLNRENPVNGVNGVESDKPTADANDATDARDATLPIYSGGIPQVAIGSNEDKARPSEIKSKWKLKYECLPQNIDTDSLRDGRLGINFPEHNNVNKEPSKSTSDDDQSWTGVCR